MEKKKKKRKEKKQLRHASQPASTGEQQTHVVSRQGQNLRERQCEVTCKQTWRTFNRSLDSKARDLQEKLEKQQQHLE